MAFSQVVLGVAAGLRQRREAINQRLQLFKRRDRRQAGRALGRPAEISGRHGPLVGQRAPLGLEFRPARGVIGDLWAALGQFIDALGLGQQRLIAVDRGDILGQPLHARTELLDRDAGVVIGAHGLGQNRARRIIQAHHRAECGDLVAQLLIARCVGGDAAQPLQITTAFFQLAPLGVELRVGGGGGLGLAFERAPGADRDLAVANRLLGGLDAFFGLIERAFFRSTRRPQGIGLGGEGCALGEQFCQPRAGRHEGRVGVRAFLDEGIGP